LQTNIEVNKFKFKARMKLFRDKIRNSIIFISCSRLDYHKFQTSIVEENTFDSSYYRSLNTRISIISRVILIDKNFNEVKHA